MSESEKKDKRHGDKRKACIQIMNEMGPGCNHGEMSIKVREAVNKVNVELGKLGDFTDASARSMIRFCISPKDSEGNAIPMLVDDPNWKTTKLDFGRKAREVKPKAETKETEKSQGEQRGTPERLQTIKNVAAKMKKEGKLSGREKLINATKEIEKLAAAGAHLKCAETETTRTAA